MNVVSYKNCGTEFTESRGQFEELSRQAFIPHARKNGISVSASANARNNVIFVGFGDIYP